MRYVVLGRCACVRSGTRTDCRHDKTSKIPRRRLAYLGGSDPLRLHAVCELAAHVGGFPLRVAFLSGVRLSRSRRLPWLVLLFFRHGVLSLLNMFLLP